MNSQINWGLHFRSLLLTSETKSVRGSITFKKCINLPKNEPWSDKETSRNKPIKCTPLKCWEFQNTLMAIQNYILVNWYLIH